MSNPGTVPQIHFEDVTNNFVYKLTRRPFNLTATIVSDLNLTLLYWSPPELVRPLPNKTITVRNGNKVTTTLMLLKDATLGDSGNYTLTAVNECGQSSLKMDVDVLTGKLIDHYRFVFSISPVEHWREHTRTHTHTHTHTHKGTAYNKLLTNSENVIEMNDKYRIIYVERKQ